MARNSGSAEELVRQAELMVIEIRLLILRAHRLKAKAGNKGDGLKMAETKLLDIETDLVWLARSLAE